MERHRLVTGWTDYPTFRRVEEIGRDEYEALLFSCPPPEDPQGMVPSDYLWLSLMAWCPEAEAARIGDGFCLRMPAYHGDTWLTALIAHSASVEAAETLLADPDVGASLHFVPKWLACSLGAEARLSVTADRDNFDYIRDVSAFVAASGPEFGQIRRERARYSRAHPEAQCCEARDWCPDDLLNVFDQWTAMRDRGSDSDAFDERVGVARLLQREDLDRCLVVLTHVDGVPVGFAVAEVQRDGSSVGHFQKMATRESGAWQHQDLAVFEALASRGVELHNFEQDLGVPGLRARKLQDRPAFLLEKYVVTLA